jgi:cholesterol transport system auxiliary component
MQIRTLLHVTQFGVPMALVALLCLVGCYGPTGRADPAVFDLSTNRLGRELPTQSKVWPIYLAEVRAPVWLDTPAMQYRLMYAEPQRRWTYTASRWVARPAELLAQELRHGGAGRTWSSGHKLRAQRDGCRLDLELVEFIQVFDAPATSQAVIEVRATLLAPGNGGMLAQHLFREHRPAGATAISGVHGFVEGVGGLSSGLERWLDQLAEGRLAGFAVCREGLSQ